jgi:predicted nucleic acid-binding protein
VVAKYRKPCWDSSLFIAGLGDGEIVKGIKRGVVFRYLWEKAKTKEFPVLISAIAIAEVYKKKKRVTADHGLLDEFLEHINEPFVEVIEVDREIGLAAHSLCREYSANKLYPNDAIHLACALRAGCDVLLAWDTPLVAISHPRIRIEEPTIYERTLFTETEIATPDEIEGYGKRIAAEAAANVVSGNEAAVLRRDESADALADQIVNLHRDGKLPTPFTTKHVREYLSGSFEASHLNTVLPNYCVGGDQVKRGRRARFNRVSRGNYISL